MAHVHVTARSDPVTSCRWAVPRPKAEPRARLLSITDPDGRRWLPVFTTEAAAQAFRASVQLHWPEHGMGLAQAVIGSTSGAAFQVADLPVDGVVIDPCGPGLPRTFSLEQCERVARYRAA